MADIYEKRGMWANVHMRGRFFAGLRTTSWCEALHSQIGKYVKAGYNLTEFIEHFQRFLEYMRFKENGADYNSCYGEPVIRTELKELERHASMVYTRAVFNVFRDVLLKTSTVKVLGYKQTASITIFFVGKYCKTGNTCHISFESTERQFKCSCLRMESFGIPCVHIIGVMVYLDLTELPKCLILQRWTKMAKKVCISNNQAGGLVVDSQYMSMYTALLDDCRDMCHVAACSFEDYLAVKEKVYQERVELRAKQSNRGLDSQAERMSRQNTEVGDPERVRHKGCGSRASVGTGQLKRVQRCRKCRQEGHNSRKCPFGSQDPNGECSRNVLHASGNDDEFESIDNNGTQYMADQLVS